MNIKEFEKNQQIIDNLISIGYEDEIDEDFEDEIDENKTEDDEI